MLTPGLENLFAVLFGLITGSFANVVIWRMPRDESLVRPGSRCPKCRKKIRWHQNIPVLSWVVLGGKCGECRARISVRYPIIELAMAILFLICAQRTGWVPALFVRDWPFVFALVSLTAIDLEHRIIPDEISLGGLAYGLLTGWFFSPLSFAELVAGAGVGFGFFYLVAWAYQKYSGKEGLGGGDVKLIAMLGSFVGIYGVLWTILASSVLGSVAGVIVGALARKSKLLQTAIPYGPFLALGALVYYLFGLGTESWLPFTNLM